MIRVTDGGKANSATVMKLDGVQHTQRSSTADGEHAPQAGEASPGLVPPQEALVDVGLQEARVAVPGHQAVDELLRRVEGRQARLAEVPGDALSGPAVYVDLKRDHGAQGPSVNGELHLSLPLGSFTCLGASVWTNSE